MHSDWSGTVGKSFTETDGYPSHQPVSYELNADSKQHFPCKRKRNGLTGNSNANLVPLGSGWPSPINELDQQNLLVLKRKRHRGEHDDHSRLKEGNISQYSDNWRGQQSSDQRQDRFYRHGAAAGQSQPHQNGSNYDDGYEAGTKPPHWHENEKPAKESWRDRLAQRNMQFYCNTCNLFCMGNISFTAHLKGKTHYKNELQLKLSNDLKLFNDHLVHEKVIQIEMGMNELHEAELLVRHVEEALFSVSNSLSAVALDVPQQPNPLFRGVMRIGLMAKQLLLKMDRRVHLVLLCSVVPTIDLLLWIVHLLRQIINKKDEPSSNFYVEEKVSESAIFISKVGVSVDVYVTLTCSAMRQWSPQDLVFYPYEEPPNALPSGPCLLALAEMRRTKFYQFKSTSLPWMNLLVKIMRDIRSRVMAWQVLTDWMIELTVAKVLTGLENSAHFGCGDALLALFTAISDGFVLGEGTQLFDPCEKLPVDVLASVSDDDRLTIYGSAQYSLRQIMDNQIVTLLALDVSSAIKSVHLPERKKMEPITSHNANTSANDGLVVQTVSATVATAAVQQSNS